MEAQTMTEPDSGHPSEKTAPACAWPECGSYVSPGDLFCREHWFRLPRGHRDAVRAALEWVRAQAAVEDAAR